MCSLDWGVDWLVMTTERLALFWRRIIWDGLLLGDTVRTKQGVGREEEGDEPPSGGFLSGAEGPSR